MLLGVELLAKTEGVKEGYIVGTADGETLGTNVGTAVGASVIGTHDGLIEEVPLGSTVVGTCFVGDVEWIEGNCVGTEGSIDIGDTG